MSTIRCFHRKISVAEKENTLSGVLTVHTQLGSTCINLISFSDPTSLENTFCAVYSEGYDHDAHTCRPVRVCTDCACNILDVQKSKYLYIISYHTFSKCPIISNTLFHIYFLA